MKDQGAAVIVAVNDSVLQEHVPLFRERLNDVIDQKKYWIIFDMLETSYISSMGISVLLTVKRKAIEGGGDVLFANVNRLIMNLFDVTELIRKLEVFSSVEEALDAVKKRAG
jgi:anti-anti-sigma factor